MNTEEKEVKILTLSMIYEKEETVRWPFLEKISCLPEELAELLHDIYYRDFHEWVVSVAPIICRNY